MQAPQLQTPNVYIYSRGCNCYCNCGCNCDCDCILFFLLYYRECYANFRNRECRPESVVLTFSLPRLLHRPRRILRRVLGPEMKFKWICIGIRLNRLCKHFVSFHLRAFRFLGSLTVNSAMWMCESFPVLPLPLPSSSSTPICGHVSTAAPQPSTLCPRLAHFAPFDLPRRRRRRCWFSAFPLRSGKITLKSLKSWFRRSSNLHNSHMFELVCACLCLHAALFSQLHLISRNCIYISIRYISVFMN